VADIHDVPDASMMAPVQPMDIAAPLEDLSGMAAAAVSANGPRQAEALAVLESPQGAGLDGQDVMAGFTGGWPADIEPGDPVNPIQGSGDYPAGM
jgi:hypothetical protein